MNTVYCRACKEPIDISDVFCKSCGADQRSASQQPTQMTPVGRHPQTNSRFLPILVTSLIGVTILLCAVIAGVLLHPLHQPAANSAQSPSDIARTPDISSLDRVVEDFNADLQRARDAHANSEAAMKMISDAGNRLNAESNLVMSGTATDEGIKQIGEDSIRIAKSEGDKQVAYWAEERQALQSAIDLLAPIQANPAFQQNYVEGELCLTHEQVPSNLPQAEDLHFIHHR